MAHNDADNDFDKDVEQTNNDAEVIWNNGENGDGKDLKSW